MGQAEMLSRITFVETLTEAMFNLSSAAYLKLRTQDATYASNVNIVEGPYKLGSVIVIDPPSFLCIEARHYLSFSQAAM